MVKVQAAAAILAIVALSSCLRENGGVVELKGRVELIESRPLFSGPSPGIVLSAGAKGGAGRDESGVGLGFAAPSTTKNRPWRPLHLAVPGAADCMAGEMVALLDGTVDASAAKERAVALLERASLNHQALSAVQIVRASCVARRLCLFRLEDGAGKINKERTRLLVSLVNQALTEAAGSAQTPIRVVATNAIYRALKLPGDPFYLQQRWHYEMVGLPGAWEISLGDAQMVVAVLDTGLNMRHPDFAGRLIPGIDLVSDPNLAGDADGRDLDPTDPGLGTFFHGTHVAGTIGAASDNGVGGTGVTWLGRVQAVRVLGNGAAGTAFDILSGLYWSVGETDFESDDGDEAVPALNESPARVVNLSLGAPFEAADHELWLATAQDILVERAERFGFPIIVVAAGNENQAAENVTPANVSLFLTVGAHGLSGDRALYSNGGELVDILAPGGSGGSLGNDPSNEDGQGGSAGDGIFSLFGGDYGFLVGTSMAAPHVAGVAALALAVAPELRHENVVTLLKNSAAPRSCDGCGAGLLDAFAALISLAEPGDGARLVVDRSLVLLQRGATSPGRLRIANLGDETLNLTVEVAGPGADRFGLSSTVLSVAPGSIAALAVTSAQARGRGSSASLVVRGVGAAEGQVAIVQLLTLGEEMRKKFEVGEVLVEAWAGTATARQHIKSTIARAADRLAWTLDLEPGSYWLTAVGDDNGDGIFDLETEAKGAWPTLGQPEVLLVEDALAEEPVRQALPLGQEIILPMVGGRLLNGEGELGAACNDDDDCLWASDAICSPEEFCTRVCDLDSDCGLGGVCLWDGCQDAGCGICFQICTGTSQCPIEQVCAQEGRCSPTGA